MRVVTAVGAVVFSAGAAFGGYLVELDGGDRMTVDSYWPDGDRMHLVRGGVDLSVPRSRVRTVREVSDDPAKPELPPAAASPTAGRASTQAAPEPSRKELERQQVRVDRHAVRAQIRASQARARGDSPETLRRLQKDIDRLTTQQRELKQALGAE